jgi:hypothetical protein
MSTTKTSRRDFLKKAAAGTVGAGVVASGLGAGVKSAAAAPAAVRTRAIEPNGVFWGLNYQPHVQAYHRMADLFHKLYGSTVTVQPQPGAPYTNLIASIAAGTQPDLAFTLAALINPLAIQGALNTLNNTVLKAQLGSDYRSYFLGDAIDAFSFQGNTFGIPSEADGGLGLVVNVPVDDVRKLGLGSKYPPTNGQVYFKSTSGPLDHAYDDMFNLAKALQIVKGGKVTRYGISGEGWDDAAIGSIMATLGVPVFDAAHEKFNFTTPEAIQAMRLHVEIPVKMGIEKEWGPGNDVTTLPLQGKVAMSIGNGSPIFNGGQYGYHFLPAVVPKINGKLIAFGTGQVWGSVGPVKVQHPNLQTAFLRMMCTNPGQQAYLLTYQGVDVVAWRWALTDTSRYIPKNATNGEWVAWQQGWIQPALEACQFVGPAGYWNKVETAIAAASQGVRAGKLTSAQGCAQIQQAAEVQYRQYKIDLANLQ